MSVKSSKSELVPHRLFYCAVTVVIGILLSRVFLSLLLFCGSRVALREIDRKGGLYTTRDCRPDYLRKYVERDKTAVFDSVNGVVLLDTEFNDADAARLSYLRGIEYLQLDCTKISDAGVAHLARLTDLREIGLRDTSLTDLGLVHLARLPKLRRLTLTGTAITDQGLELLMMCTALEELDVGRTQVSDAGVATICKALPRLRVTR